MKAPSRRSALLALLLGVSPALAAPPTVGTCEVFPADNIWNVPVTHLPVHPRSADYVRSIGADTGLHPDFGSGWWDGGPIGIPFVIVGVDQADVPIRFYYRSESDPGPYPIPADAPIEGGDRSQGDRHVLVVDEATCTLYEVYKAYPRQGGGWFGGSGAVFDMRSNDLRPEGWTSADAAGLPILPGLVRWEEVASGEIKHALRFTAAQTQSAYVWPARHEASSDADPTLPPMGARFRLKASVDLSSFSPEVRVILRAMQVYGIILADNGSDWYISGAPDPSWDNDVLHELGRIHGSDFEAVDASGLMVDPDSGGTR